MDFEPKLHEEDELIYRLPEIESIEDEEIRELVIEIFMEDCPEYFWTKPASSSGKYHHPVSTGDHGLWIHTKMAFGMFERLARSYKHQGKLTEKEVDYGRAAILLHDLFKYGWPGEENEHTVKDHDVLAYTHLRDNFDVPEPILDCILSHNGPWGKGKGPDDTLQEIHHAADMAASNTDVLVECEWTGPLQSVIDSYYASVS